MSLSAKPSCFILLILFILLLPSHLLFSQNCSASFNFETLECGSVSFTPDTIIDNLTYAWNFGDDSTSNIPQPIHIYDTFDSAVDTFLATLTVSSDSCFASSSASVILERPIQPVASFTPSADFGCAPLMIEFANTSNTVGADSVEFIWEVVSIEQECIDTSMEVPLDTVIFDSIEPTIKFEQPGIYEVMLYTVNECGEGEAIDTITVADSPQAEITGITDLLGYGIITPSVNYNSCNDTVAPNFSWSFPGGSPSSHTGGTPPDIFYINNSDSIQTYTIELLVTASCDTFTLSQSFEVRPSLIYEITLSDDTTCSSIFVNNPVTDTSFHYLWSTNADEALLIGESTPDPIVDFSEVEDESAYEIYLLATSPVYDTIRRTLTAYYLTPPIIDIAQVDDACAPLEFVPQAEFGTTNLANVQWTIFDSTGNEVYNSSSAIPEEVSLPTPGIYELETSASNYCGVDIDSKTFEIFPPITLDAQLQDNMVCQGEIANIINNSSGDSLNINWSATPPIVLSDEAEFEPSIFTENVPASTYQIVAALGSNRCPTIFDTLELEVLLEPSVSIEVSPNGILCSGDELMLMGQVADTLEPITAQVAVSPTGEIINYNDLTPRAYTVQDSGSYIFDLVLESANGCSTSSSTTVNVNLSPNSSFNVVEEVCFGNTTTFANNSSLTLPQSLYFWDFGGEGQFIGSSIVVDYQFEQNGQTYPVQLIVDNQNGCRDTSLRNVTSKLSPVASFTIDSACVDEAVTITNISSFLSNNVTYLLDTGDGNDTPLINFGTRTETYDSPGEYNLQLIVNNNNGCLDTVSSSTEIFPLPMVEFMPLEQSTACVGDEAITLSATPTGGLFSGLNTSNTPDEDDGQGTFSPSTTGQNIPFFYSVVDTNGCVGSDSLFFEEVYPLPDVELIGLDLAYCFMDGVDTLVGVPPGGSFEGPQGVLVQGNQSDVAFFDPQAVIGNDSISYTYTDENGCVNVASQDFVINELPVANIIVEGGMSATDTILIGAEETLNLTNVAISETLVFNWSNGSESAVTEIQNPGFYTLNIADQETGCMSSDTVLVLLTTSTREATVEELSFQFGPNPISDMLYFSFEAYPHRQLPIMTLCNNQGKQIKKWKAMSTMTIDLSQLPSGVYWLRVGTHRTVRLIKQ